jgi:U32 family peptidase
LNKKHLPDRENKTALIPEKPELLAPAGSPATWAAAVEAGADAVYLGLKNYSARAFASNFSPSELARVIELSHERGVKIFVAFNSLLKENDLKPALELLDLLARTPPDALILQDLGLLRLVKHHYPQYEVHASTLMAVHNRGGLDVLGRMGFDRAVLARELTLKEVERLATSSPVGVEIFIHGALCFSFSGLCLMSSFLGGKGSLRGACTQPCRRYYSQAKRKGYFFSPTDLDATTLMGHIRRLPLAALKIEGRMKGAEYVRRVVSAYRLLLDVSDDDLEIAMEEAGRLIDASLGRQRSTGFFMSARAEQTLAPNLAATSGLFLGRVLDGGPDGGLIVLENNVAAGDRLRVQFRQDDSRKAFTLKELRQSGMPVGEGHTGQEVFIASPQPLTPGDLVFKVDTGTGEKEALASPLVQALTVGSPGSGRMIEHSPSKALNSALRMIGSGSSGGRRPQNHKPDIWYRLGRAEDVQGLAPSRPGRVILPLTTPNVRRMAGLRRRLDTLYQKIVWALPPLVFDSASLIRDLSQLARMGAREFMISNLGHLPLVQQPRKGRRNAPIIYADHRLNCLNSQAELQLADLGVSALTLSLEGDEDNFKRLLSNPGPISRLLYLYGRPALFTSRFAPQGLKENTPVESPQRERFRTRYQSDIMFMFAEQPVFFAPLLKFRTLAGVTAFIVDLEFDPRPLATARDILEVINRGKPQRSTSRFNFKRGLY